MTTTRPSEPGFACFPWISLAAAAAAVVVYPSPLLQGLLQYDREAIAAGELWRLLTCHWTHWSVGHLGWDVSMFVLLSIACERMHRRATIMALGCATLLIPMVVWAALPEMQTYRGLSGLDSALFALLAARVFQQSLICRDRRRLVSIGALAAAFAGKMLYEAMLGSAVFVHDSADMVPVPLAHIAGAAVGLMAAWMGAMSRTQSFCPTTSPRLPASGTGAPG